MRIKNIGLREIKVEVEYRVTIRYEGNTFDLYVTTINGKWQGYKKVSTARLRYFDLPARIRMEHYREIKQMITDGKL